MPRRNENLRTGAGKIDYARLATEIAKQLSPVFPLQFTHDITGVAKILRDDCVHFEFQISGKGDESGDDGGDVTLKFKFEKKGHESWVDTVKHSHRNKKKISVNYGTEKDKDGNHSPNEMHDAE